MSDFKFPTKEQHKELDELMTYMLDDMWWGTDDKATLREGIIAYANKWNEIQSNIEAKQRDLDLSSTISRFLFDQSDKLKVQVNEICVTIDPCHKDDKWVDLVIYDDNWNELKRIKTLAAD